MIFAQLGDFCPNESCPEYGKLQSAERGNIKKAGKTKQGRQWYQRKSCRQTFTGTTGTLFYHRRTPKEEIIKTLAFIAEGAPPPGPSEGAQGGHHLGLASGGASAWRRDREDYPG